MKQAIDQLASAGLEQPFSFGEFTEDFLKYAKRVLPTIEGLEVQYKIDGLPGAFIEIVADLGGKPLEVLIWDDKSISAVLYDDQRRVGARLFDGGRESFKEWLNETN